VTRDLQCANQQSTSDNLKKNPNIVFILYISNKIPAILTLLRLWAGDQSPPGQAPLGHISPFAAVGQNPAGNL